MTRQPQAEENDVSLFPFLSVLACIIGTLTLMIAGVALGQMDNETVVSSEQYEQVREQLAEVRTDVARLRQRTTGAQTQMVELAEARAALERLAAQLAAARQESDETGPGEPLPNIDLPALEEELSKLTEQVDALEKLVAQRNRPPEEAEVQIQPGGTGVDIDPWFVECRSDSIVLYSDAEPVRIPKSQIGSDAKFLDLLARVAESRRASVVFLIRDDGIDTYNAAHRVAQANYAKNAKLPVLGQGNLDLSLFEPEP